MIIVKKWLINAPPLHFAIDSLASRMAASSGCWFSCSLPKRIRKFNGYLEDKMTRLYEGICQNKGQQKRKEQSKGLKCY